MYSDNRRHYNYPSFRMKKKDADTYSGTSGTSRASAPPRKPPRLSLRRLFFPPTRRGVRSRSDVESRSISSLPSTTVAAVDDNESTSSGLRECPLCLAQLSADNFPVIHTCHHRSCRDCLKQYLKIEITESRINIACPECSERFHPNDIQAILEDRILMDKYELFMLRRVLVLDPDTRWCPAPDCGYAVIASGCASCPKLHCERPGCDTSFCYHCKQYWHPNQTCDAARAQRNIMRSSSLSYSHESGNQSEIKPCPRCSAFIIKMDDGSCNHMTCAVCGAEFCWLCMKEISDLHYLSPSGCTFWGRKPWSRKKKILWQLGTLVGAPVGISLVAGIAVPAMIIGIPVWVGRKLRTKFEHAPKHKRNLIITGGVSASILVSPIIAGLAVGIGVPILLAYVYGVVPVSLCRSGGCGVTTTNSGGVRFEFDEDNDVTVGVSGPYSVEDVTTPAGCGGPGTGSRVANPSIAPSIGEVSMTMTGSLHSHAVDSDSIRAIAPASLDGASVTNYTCSNRLEVQADVATGNKRASLSSESANFSIDAKSASFGDDTASTKALAGSLCMRDTSSGDDRASSPSRSVTFSKCRIQNHSLSLHGGESQLTPVASTDSRESFPASTDTTYVQLDSTYMHGDSAGSSVSSVPAGTFATGSSISSIPAATFATGSSESSVPAATFATGSSDSSGPAATFPTGGSDSSVPAVTFVTGSSDSSVPAATFVTGSSDSSMPAGTFATEVSPCPFPDTGLPPYVDDTYRSASELRAACLIQNKKRSLSMNDSSEMSRMSP